MGDRSIELWLNQYQLEALERILSEHGTDTETVMQARLMEFYRQTVPEQERTEINNMIEAERLADERRTQEMRHFSVYHNGERLRVSLRVRLWYGIHADRMADAKVSSSRV